MLSLTEYRLKNEKRTNGTRNCRTRVEFLNGNDVDMGRRTELACSFRRIKEEIEKRIVNLII